MTTRAETPGSILTAAVAFIQPLLPGSETSAAVTVDLLLTIYAGEITRLTDPQRVLHRLESWLTELPNLDTAQIKRRLQLVNHLNEVVALADPERGGSRLIGENTSKILQLQTYHCNHDYNGEHSESEDTGRAIYGWSKSARDQLTARGIHSDGFLNFAFTVIETATTIRYIHQFDTELQREFWLRLGPYTKQVEQYHTTLFAALADFLIEW